MIKVNRSDEDDRRTIIEGENYGNTRARVPITLRAGQNQFTFFMKRLLTKSLAVEPLIGQAFSAITPAFSLRGAVKKSVFYLFFFFFSLS